MTPHNQAQPGEIASQVIVCGDPVRAEKMAIKFLENPVLINSVRGMKGYTGKAGNKEISILSVGMGTPSIGIYVQELFDHYGVEAVIRVGTAGSIHKNIRIGDSILATAASTDSAFAGQYRLPGTFSAVSDFHLAKKASELYPGFKTGNVLTSDYFYLDDPDFYDPWKKMNLLAVEMEVAALYTLAARAGRKALALLKITDDLIRDEHMSAQERESIDDLFQVAIEVLNNSESETHLQ